ncbi:MAG: LysR family transcriptional regulator [Chloroflexota bacterium]|nr:LysR family transcriptional regulator [Chloroflexota bacterium]
MDLARMRVFQAVADAGSFSRAARALFLSQPAITQHIHALEAELGVPLFDRLGRRTTLTPAGASLAQHVPQIIGLVRAAETAAREAGGEASRTLRLGVSETLATYVLPPMLGDLQQRLPDTELRLTVADSAELLLALLNNDIELAFWLREAAHPHLEQTVFADEPLVWVLPPGDRLGLAPGLPASAFPGRRLILRKRNSAARRVIQALLERELAFPSNVLEMDNLEAIKRAVEVGFGISIAPRSAVLREQQAGTLSVVPLAAPDAYITSSYAQCAGRRLSAPARAFVEVLETLRGGRSTTR